MHQTQYPRVFTIVKRKRARRSIFRCRSYSCAKTTTCPSSRSGFGEPYALVLSSHWIEIFADDELAFMIGRELGHIAAGHTRFHSLLSVNGNENPLDLDDLRRVAAPLRADVR